MIGRECKCSNVLSGPVLIRRGLDLKAKRQVGFVSSFFCKVLKVWKDLKEWMRIFRSYARKTRRATGDNTGVYRPSEPQADEAEGGKDHPVEPGFLWRPQGKASERREGILKYVEQARRRLDEAGTQKDGSKIR